MTINHPDRRWFIKNKPRRYRMRFATEAEEIVYCRRTGRTDGRLMMIIKRVSSHARVSRAVWLSRIDTDVIPIVTDDAELERLWDGSQGFLAL